MHEAGESSAREHRLPRLDSVLETERIGRAQNEDVIQVLQADCRCTMNHNDGDAYNPSWRDDVWRKTHSGVCVRCFVNDSLERVLAE